MTLPDPFESDAPPLNVETTDAPPTSTASSPLEPLLPVFPDSNSPVAASATTTSSSPSLHTAGPVPAPSPTVESGAASTLVAAED